MTFYRGFSGPGALFDPAMKEGIRIAGCHRRDLEHPRHRRGEGGRPLDQARRRDPLRRRREARQGEAAPPHARRPLPGGLQRHVPGRLGPVHQGDDQPHGPPRPDHAQWRRSGLVRRILARSARGLPAAIKRGRCDPPSPPGRRWPGGPDEGPRPPQAATSSGGRSIRKPDPLIRPFGAPSPGGRREWSEVPRLRLRWPYAREAPPRRIGG